MENTIKETTRLLLQGTLTKDEADKILLSLSNVSKRYSIDDIEKCVENWGLCRVEKEYIERFLNGC